jgi:Polymerase beta, Nucleotidyltransferase
MRFFEQEFQDLVCSSGFLAAYVHGSQISGTARPDSDLDVAFLAPRTWTDNHLGAKAETLCHAVAEAKHFPANRVHYQNLRDCPPYFAFRVLSDGVLLGVSDTTALAEYQAQTYCRHWDEERFLAPILEAFSKRVQRSGYAS